jgi:hypothetical protein
MSFTTGETSGTKTAGLEQSDLSIHKVDSTGKVNSADDNAQLEKGY